jgi:hypothetical protein
LRQSAEKIGNRLERSFKNPAAIGRLPILRSVEAFIVTLPPYPALLFFATPTLLLVPLKIIALYFMSHGQATLGMLTIIAAKFAGTALVARIFTLTRPQLLSILTSRQVLIGSVLFASVEHFFADINCFSHEAGPELRAVLAVGEDDQSTV